MRNVLILAILVLAASAAQAAELPSRDAKPSAANAKRCEIAGKPGVLAADGQTCIRVSGYVSGQVSAGAWK